MHAVLRLRYRCVHSLLFAVVVLAEGFSLPAQAQKLIVFDARKTSTLPYQGTEASGINASGTIVGDFSNNAGGVHGFLRKADGSIAVFDAPGANPSPGYPCLYGLGGTCPTAVNDRGQIVDNVGDVNSAFHGFVRAPNRQIAEFDAPGAGTGAYQGTYPMSINNPGAVTGYYVDAGNVLHGFLRPPDGTVVSFDDGAIHGKAGWCINDEGVIAGWDIDANSFSNGFIRYRNCRIIVFDPPTTQGGTLGIGGDYINDDGVVSGSFFEAGTNVAYGFVGSPEGKYAEFTLPDAGTNAFDGVYVGAANSHGVTVGHVTDSNVENHSFVRFPNGKAVVFDVPGQMHVPGSDFGSAAEAINNEGVVAGRWHDTGLVLHAYVRSPE